MNFILLLRFPNINGQRILTYILSFKDQWNITDSQTNLASDKSKGELRDSGTTQDQEIKAVKKAGLFEEDNEDDLFAIAKDR